MQSFDLCALEDVEESKNDASKNTTSKITKTPAARLTPAIMLKHGEEIMAKLKESAKQRNEAYEQSGSPSSEPRDSGSLGSQKRVQTMATSETGSLHDQGGSGESQRVHAGHGEQ